MRWLIAILALICTNAVVRSQTTWVVDSQNAAGAHFTDIPPAVAVAVDGDRIVVRGRGTTPGTT